MVNTLDKVLRSVPDKDLINGKILRKLITNLVGVLDKNFFTSTKLVTTISDFGVVQSGKVYPRSDILYFIDPPEGSGGIFDTEGVTIVLPTGGFNCGYLNAGREVCLMFSDANNYNMFESPSGSYTGNVVFESLRFCVTGTSSKIFNLDNDGNGGVIEFAKVNFGDFNAGVTTAFGTLADFRQVLIEDSGFFNATDGFTLNGTFSGGVKITNSNCINSQSGFTLLKNGTSTVVNEIITDMKFETVNADAKFTDLSPSNITKYVDLRGFRTNATNALPNIPNYNAKALFDNKCRGVKATQIGGAWQITSATATTIAGISTAVKLAGTTTVVGDLTHFDTGSSPTNNRLRYIGENSIDVSISGIFSLTSGNNQVLKIYARQWDDSAGAFISLTFYTTVTTSTGGSVETARTMANATMDTNDYIEIWVENQTAVANITAQVGGQLIITRR